MSTPERSLELKVPPVAVFVACALIALVLGRLTPQFTQPVSTIHWVSAGMCLVSAAILGGWAIRQFTHAGTTVHPQRPDATSRLVFNGIYGFSRNPMYLALAMLLGAVIALLANPLGLAGLILFIKYIERYQIEPEERALKAKFGTDFDTYCRYVRRWL